MCWVSAFANRIIEYKVVKDPAKGARGVVAVSEREEEHVVNAGEACIGTGEVYEQADTDNGVVLEAEGADFCEWSQEGVVQQATGRVVGAECATEGGDKVKRVEVACKERAFGRNTSEYKEVSGVRVVPKRGA